MKTLQMMKCVTGVLVLVSGLAQAVVINVPDDQPTIQAGINAAVSGVDEVVVAPGTYPEAIDFLGKAITVRSASGDPTDTIIDGTGLSNDHVVQCVNSETAATVLQGFTLTGGNANGTSPDNRGGGMYCDGSSPTVTHCTFIANLANVNGGGMYNNSSSPTVTDCVFIANTPGADGGGMYNDNSSSPTITDCIFSGHTANSGGGMYNRSNSSPVITDCLFSGNMANFNGGGMVNNVNCNPTIINCTFSSNTGNVGGGMFNDSSSPATENSIFWNNSDSGGLDESAQIHTISGTPTVDYSNVMAGWTGVGGNNINTDPLFIDADGDDDTVGTDDDNLRLQTGSPCIDAGDNTALPVGITTDLDGNTRISHLIVDMGAYEFQDADGDGIPDESDTLTVHNITQVSDYFTLQLAIDAASNSDTVEADPGTYNETINFLGKAITLRSSSGDPNDTIIDGSGNFHVAQCVTGETAGTVLQGFTLTGGNANGGSFPSNAGGGMLCNLSSPTISDCIFSANSAEFGGGMFNYINSNPTVVNCTFTANTANLGGGLFNFNNNSIITHCTFIANTLGADGGGMFNQNSNPTITDCSFNGNATNNGGAMLNFNSSPAITHCIFSGNIANFNGGAMVNKVSSNPTITNCTFNANTADIGGGMFNDDSSPATHNSIFWDNSDSGGLDESAQIHNISGTPTVNYSNVMAAWTGLGGNNISADPLFVDADGADNIFGTIDDDLHLQSGSLCIDAADSTPLTVENITLDVDGKLRFVNFTGKSDTGAGLYPYLDMGPYETSFDCTLSGDINCDGIVDLFDLALLAANWLTTI
jgi:hypothetical protein